MASDEESLSEKLGSKLNISDSTSSNGAISIGDGLVNIMSELRKKLQTLTGGQQEGDKISIEILNPLEEYWSLHETYLKKAPKTTEVLFIPFYADSAMKDFFDKDQQEIISGIKMRNSDSGALFWKLMEEDYNPVDKFFEECFLINFCPLIFKNDKGKNIPLSDLDPKGLLNTIISECQKTVKRVIDVLQPQSIIGIGEYAFDRVAIARDITLLKHPACRGKKDDWFKTAENQLNENPFLRGKRSRETALPVNEN